MRELPRSARIYITGVLAVAAVLATAAVVAAPPRLAMAPVAGLLLLIASVAQQFKVKSPKHQSYYTTTIFIFSAALLLRPGYVIAIILVSHLVELTRQRYRWYILAFNVANFSLSALAAAAIFHLRSPSPEWNPIGYALAAGLAFVLVNHLLTALVIMWARNVPIARAGTLDVDNLGTDLALMTIGALGSLLWLTDPLMVPLCLGPLFLIYRSLLVPFLQEEARTDPKTELFNMKHWNQVAEMEIDRARRFNRPLSVLLGDLDLLREANNRYGHLMGDQLIRRVAETIRGALREYDVPARFGGDEFAVLMPEANLDEASAVAERIRHAVELIELKAPDGGRLSASLSVGVALFPVHGGTPSTLLAAADRAVYQAKALGRNRVCAFREPDDSTSSAVASAAGRRALA